MVKMTETTWVIIIKVAKNTLNEQKLYTLYPLVIHYAMMACLIKYEETRMDDDVDESSGELCVGYHRQEIHLWLSKLSGICMRIRRTPPRCSVCG